MDGSGDAPKPFGGLDCRRAAVVISPLMTAIRIRSPLIERFDIAWITEELIGISAFEEIPGFVFVAHWLFSFLVVVVWDLRQEGLSRGLTSSPLLRVHHEGTTPTSTAQLLILRLFVLFGVRVPVGPTSNHRPRKGSSSISRQIDSGSLPRKRLDSVQRRRR